MSVEGEEDEKGAEEKVAAAEEEEEEGEGEGEEVMEEAAIDLSLDSETPRRKPESRRRPLK